jgi:hypothetical protein
MIFIQNAMNSEIRFKAPPVLSYYGTMRARFADR